MGFTLTKFGAYVPDTIVTNNDFAKIMDTSDEWIKSRTGISERRYANISSTQMAIEAAKDLVERNNVDVSEIDVVLVASASPAETSPTMAVSVKGALGIGDALAFDLNSACSGFVIGVQTAHAFLQTGRYKKALIIGTEMLSRYQDFNDRTTSILFADGAGAAILEKTDKKGIVAEYANTKFAPKEVLSVDIKPFGNKTPWTNELGETSGIKMKGTEVYKFAVRAATDATKRAIEEAGWTNEEVDYVVVHQANTRIIDHISKSLGIPSEKLPVNLHKTGNTSSASIPLLLAELAKDGVLPKPGMKIVITGFGGGLSWGSIAIEY